MSITAICGRFNPGYEKLCRKYNDEKIHILSSVDDIWNYMADSDLCISAAGSTLYELCACGIPTISYILADNQVENAACLNKDGIIYSIGDIRNDIDYSGLSILLEKCAAYSFRKDIRSKMKKNVDVNGAESIIKGFINVDGNNI